MGAFDDLIPASQSANPGAFDDLIPAKTTGGLAAAAKQAIGSTIKGVGQAATDFLPGVTASNPVSAYGQSVIDANPTATNSLGDIVESPWTATKEAVGNAAGSMGSMLGARALGTGITLAAPFTGPAAPVVAGAGQLIANVGPFVAAALPSYGGIRESQIQADPANAADAKSKAIALLGAGAVGAIEGSFGPEAWALAAAKKGGFDALVKQFEGKSLRGVVGKGIAKGAAVEGSEELVQNPIEQVAGYQDPTTRQAIGETLFGGAMGAIGGGVLGGGMAGVAYRPKAQQPEQQPAAQPAATVPPVGAPPVQEPATIDPVADPVGTLNNQQAGVMAKAAATGEITGANEQKRQEQAMADTQGWKNAKINPYNVAGPAAQVAQDAGKNASTAQAAAHAPLAVAAAPTTGATNEEAQAGTAGAEGASVALELAAGIGGAGSPTGLAGVSTGAASGTAANLPGHVAPPESEQSGNVTGFPYQTVAPPIEQQQAIAAPQNTPPAPAIPVTPAAPIANDQQAEPAGAPTTTQGQQNGNKAEVTKPEAPGRPTQSAAGAGQGVAPTDLPDVSKRTDKQLAYLSTNGQPGYRDAAIAEIDRRSVGKVAEAPTLKYPQQSTTGGAPIEQQSAPMSLGEYGKSNDQAVTSQSPANKGIDLSTRTDAQIATLVKHKSPKVRALAEAEITRRAGMLPKSVSGTSGMTEAGPLRKTSTVVATETATDAPQAPLSSADAPQADFPIPAFIGAAVTNTEKSVDQIRKAISGVTSGVDGEKEYVEFDYAGDDGHNIAPGHYKIKVTGDAAKWLYRNGYLLGNDADIDAGVSAKLLIQNGGNGLVKNNHKTTSGSGSKPEGSVNLDYVVPNSNGLQPRFEGKTYRQAVEEIVDQYGRLSYLDEGVMYYPSGAPGKSYGYKLPAFAAEYYEKYRENPVKSAPQTQADHRKDDLEKRKDELLAKRKQSTAAPNMRRDDLVGAILRVTGGDGIHSSMALDTTGDTANRQPKLRGLFTNRGTIDLGDTAQKLRDEEGYDVRDGEHLAELIRQQAAGGRITSMESTVAEAEAAKEAQYRDSIRKQAKEFGLKTAFVKFSDLENRVNEVIEKRRKKLESAMDQRSQDIFDSEMEKLRGVDPDDVDAMLLDLHQNGYSGREFQDEAVKRIRAMSEDVAYTEEANRKLQEAFDAARESEEPNIGQHDDGADQESGSRPGAGRSIEAQQGEGFALSGQSDSEAAKAEADRVAAEKEKAAADAKAKSEEKATSDSTGEAARYNAATDTQSTPSDRAIYSMAAEGKTAAEILAFIGKASRRPFNRYLANALRNLGASSAVTLDSQGGWQFGNTAQAQRYAAAYNPKTDTVALFTAREAERHLLHEFVHSQTLKAIAAGGPASVQMRALFMSLKRNGALDGQYGMSNLDEFVAEAFSNPKFQAALKAMPAPKGSTLRNAWEWFVRAVRTALGMKSAAMETALDRAMTVGAQLMRENSRLNEDAQGDSRYALAWHGTPHVWGPEPGFPHGRPRLDKIGTGEGAQAYGWGWYSAQNIEVAEAYKKALSYASDSDLKVAKSRLLSMRQELDAYGGMSRVKQSDIDRQEEVVSNIVGRLAKQSIYQLDIPDAVMPHLLDWDKPLSKQTAKVQDAIEEAGLWDGDTATTGQTLYEQLRLSKKSPKATSEHLATLGIVGTRYLDGQSRRNDAGTYNYVIWDQPTLDKVALLERNGEKLDAMREADAVRYSRATLPYTITINGIERQMTSSIKKPRTQEFRDWFDGSKVTKPVYHATQSDFSSFDTSLSDLGAHFGNLAQANKIATGMRLGNREGTQIMPVWLSIKNPLRLKDVGSFHADGISVQLERKGILPKGDGKRIEREIDGDWKLRKKYDPIVISAIKDAGYDGVVYSNTQEGAGDSYIAFDATQIKSATGNNGDFSPTNPDIRYNVATDWYDNNAPESVKNIVTNAMHSDAKTSWLTPFNTQYHKAEKWSAEGKTGFKRLFDLTQRFISDVSRFAIMAQNKAPTLFHEIKSVGDAGRAIAESTMDLKNARSFRDLFESQHTKDINAIAKPLHDGTLYGGDGNPMSGVIFSDDRLRADYKLTDRQIKLYHEALAASGVSMDELAKSIIAGHAKTNKVAFDREMTVGDMADDVVRRLENVKEDMEALLDPSEQERIEAEAADLREMDMDDEADALLKAAKKDLADAAKGVARIDKTITDIRAAVAKNTKLQEHGYFPLMRFGKHVVKATSDNGKVTEFRGHYEGIPLVPRSGQYEANKVAAAIRAEHPDWTVTTEIDNDEKHKLYAGLNMEAMRLFAEHMDADMREPLQEYFRIGVGNRSVLKRLVHRKGTPGFDNDVRRTLAQFITSNARHTSSSYHMGDMTKAAEAANDDGGDIGKEAVKLLKYVQDPQDEAANLRGFLFFNFLGGSIASAMVNMTQVPMMTFPYLTRYEGSAALAKRLALAGKMAVKNPGSIGGTLGAALQQAELDGITAPQEIHQLISTAANNIFAGNRVANGLLRAWGAPFAMAESFNRRSTFIAAFQIAEGMTPAELAATKAATPFEFAERAVTDTQGIYNKGNRMNVGRGAIGSTLMTFKQYNIMYLELLKRMPPKQRAIMLGVLLLAAGGSGWPFVEDIEDIIDTIGQWLGYGTNSKKALRNAAESALGLTGADIALNGALNQMGISLHSRFGMGNLIPGSAILKESSIDRTRDIAEFFGPAASVLQNASKALKAMATGQPGRAAMAVAPNAIANAIKGEEMARTGYAEDSQGRRTVPVNGGESFAKSIGFNPKSVADLGSIKGDILQDQHMVQVKREEFTSAIADAILSGDVDARQQALADMKQWNEDNPKLRVVLTPGAVLKRVRDAKLEGVQRFMKTVPKTMRSDARAELVQ